MIQFIAGDSCTVDDNLIASTGLKTAIAITILELFEDLLEKHNITIPDEDREGDESEARLFGMTYANLEDEITAIIDPYINETTIS